MNNSLPLGWSVAKLSEIADVVSGGTPSRDVAEFWTPADVNWVTPTDITRNSKRVLSESSEKISFKGLRNSSAKTLPVGTILMTSRATLGEMKVSEVECCTNQGFKSLIVKPSTDKWFVFYQMKRKKPCYEKLGIGSTFLEVNKKDTDNFEIELPQFLQQKKIAKILITVDNLIDQTQNLIEKYTAVKQGMMADLFSRGIDLSGTADTNKNYGQLRPSFAEAPELYQETELGWVPKEWKINRFKDITDILTCGVAATPVYVEEGEGFTFLSARNIKNGRIDLSKLSYIPEWLHLQLTKHNKPRAGDILYSRVGAGYGEAAVVEINEEFSVYVSLTHIRMKSGLNQYFYKYLLNTPQIKNKASIDVFQGGGVPNLNVTEVREFQLPVPGIEEQNAIGQRLTLLDDFIFKQKSLMEKYQLKKKGLMQDLLTGKVKVN